MKGMHGKGRKGRGKWLNGNYHGDRNYTKSILKITYSVRNVYFQTSMSMVIEQGSMKEESSMADDPGEMHLSSW